MKGKTKWYPHDIKPVRAGEYECLIRIGRTLPLFRSSFVWDGDEFVTGWPWSIVVFWRGQTKAAALAGEAK